MMRTQLAVASADSAGILPPHHYDQIFTAHGVIMIFFMAMPFITGLMNVVVPLQIGARDVAYPFLNSLSFWLFGATSEEHTSELQSLLRISYAVFCLQNK